MVAQIRIKLTRDVVPLGQGVQGFAAPYDARGLGELIHRLRRPMRETTFMGMTIQAGPDLAAFMNMTQSTKALAHVTRRFTRHLADLAVHRRGMQLRNGLALVGRLLRSAADLGVEFRTSSPAIRLLRDGDRVCGAILGTPAGEVEIQACRGVVLGAGGYPHDADRRRVTFPADAEHLTVAAPAATGYGLRLGESVGGEVDGTLAAPGAWCPVSLVPYPDGTVGQIMSLGVV